MDMQARRKLKVTLPSEREIALVREFNAPRRLVYEAHTRREHLQQWWILEGMTLPVCEIDLRPGGSWRFVQRTADGSEFGFRGQYREVVPEQRLVFTFEFEGMPGHVSLVTTTFEEREGRTLLHSAMRFDSVEDRDGMLQSGMERGAAETMDRLEAHLLAMKEREVPESRVEVSRLFDAPRALLFRAWAEPERMSQWYGPKGFAIPHFTMDFRVGGRFHLCMRSPKGWEYWTSGTYREIVEPERIVYTDALADAQGNRVPPAQYGMNPAWPSETLVTITFESEGERTRVTVRHHIRFSGPELDHAKRGWSESLERLAEIVAGR